MKISDSSLAIIAICTSLASKGSDNKVNPLTINQWYKLQSILIDHKLSPSDLFSLSRKDMSEKLLLNEEVIDRLYRLLELSGKLGYEISEIRSKGIEILTVDDEEYPVKYKSKLGNAAPPVLFYSGKLQLVNNKGVAIVGSRDIDENALNFTKQLAECCTNDGLNIVSGGARGVDSIAERIALEKDGTSVIIMSNNMDRKIKDREIRRAIMNGQTLILSAQRPDMPFQAYAAMERNKYIYAAADYSIVVSSTYNKGGTWAGATENIKNKWTPIFVRKEAEVPEGNVKLLAMSNVFPITKEDFSAESISKRMDLLITNVKSNEPKQISLFE